MKRNRKNTNMKQEYINLLRSTGRTGIDNLIKYLELETDFFTAPASTKYHLSRECGLLEHSLNVYAVLNHDLKNTSYNHASVVLVSLLHDVCKANIYERNYKNVKNVDGDWIKEPYYTINDKFPMGHGEKSVIIIQKFIRLKDEEIAAIRWHMGSFVSKENYDYVNNTFNSYLLAAFLHIADLKSTYILEKQI